MKTKFLFLFALTLAIHSSFAQRLVLDTTFKPFFDVHQSNRSGDIVNVWENPKNGKLWVVGNLNIAANHKSLTSMSSNGSQNPSFVSSGISGGGSNFFPINDTTYCVMFGSAPQIIDTMGIIDLNWFNNTSNAVPCYVGYQPHFFKNGSSLMGNSIRSGNSCNPRNPPDTFAHRHFIKVDSLGYFDSTFRHTTNDRVEGFHPYDSNHIWVMGIERRFTRYDSTAVNGLCRIDLDGNIDTTFKNPLYNFGNPSNFNTYLIGETEKDGGFFLMGTFFLKSDSTKNVALARFHSNGDLDTNFLVQDDVQDTIVGIAGVQTMCKMPDGGYLVGGIFNKYQGHIMNCLAKLDSVGNLEPNYIKFRGPDSAYLAGNNYQFVNKIIASKFGGYYVVGDFLKWNNQASQPIVRLLIDSTVGLDEEKEKQRDKVNIYPNPTRGLLNLNLLNGEQLKGLQLFDLLGKEQNIPLKNRQLDLSSLPKGIYFLQLQLSSGELLSKKIIKH